jgi:hypothetical protein
MFKFKRKDSLFHLFFLLAFGLFFIAACAEEEDGDSYIDEPLIVGEITAVTSVSASQRLKLEPDIVNPTRGVTYDWRASCGSLDNVSSPTPIFTAPEVNSLISCVITLEASRGTNFARNSTLISVSPTTYAYTKLDGLSGATLATTASSGSKAYFVAQNGGKYRLHELTASSGVTLADPSSNADIGDNVAIVAANSSKIAVLTSGAARKVKVYDPSSLTSVASYDQPYPIAATGEDGTGSYTFAPLHHGEAAFALTDDYLIVGSDNETVGTFVEIYDLTAPANNKHIKSPAEVGELVSIAAQEVGGTTYLLLGGGGESGGAGGTAVYKIVTSPSLGIQQVAASDGKSNHWIKWNSSYAIESKVDDAEVKVWQWDATGGAVAKGSVKVPNGTVDATTVRALQFDPTTPSIAYVASFNGGNVYEVDLATVSGEDSAKQLLFSYPSHNGEGISAWMIEKVTAGTKDYFILSGGYLSSLGRSAPGLALVFEYTPGAAAIPKSAVYFNGLARMLRAINDGSNYFFIAKDNRASKLAVQKIN